MTLKIVKDTLGKSNEKTIAISIYDIEKTRVHKQLVSKVFDRIEIELVNVKGLYVLETILKHFSGAEVTITRIAQNVGYSQVLPLLKYVTRKNAVDLRSYFEAKGELNT